MTITINIKEESLAEFYQTVQEKGWEEPSDGIEDDFQVPQRQIDEMIRRQESTPPEAYIS